MLSANHCATPHEKNGAISKMNCGARNLVSAYGGTPHQNAKGEIDNAVLALHWTGGDSRVLLSPTFTQALFNPGRPLDAKRYYLIFPDSVGHGQSSKPSDGLKTKFPDYDYGDIVDLQHKLVTETLGIKHLHAILGMSMGGMNAWQLSPFGVMAPGVFGVMAPHETAKSGVRTGVKNA